MFLDGVRGGLAGPVGNGRESRPDDVVKVKSALGGLGRYPTSAAGASGVLDRDLDRAVRGYQEDRGLKRDGWLAPRGETARSLGADLRLLAAAGGSAPREDDSAFVTRATPAEAERATRGRADLFGGLARLGEGLGLGDPGFRRAEDHLRHYLAGSGTPKRLSSEEAGKERALEAAEQVNRLRFESRTFRGATRNQDLNRLPKELPDRQSVRFEDHFESSPGFWDYVRQPGSYFSLGRTGVRSGGAFRAKRVGNQIGIEGEIVHRLDNRGKEDNDRGRFGDPYDFANGQPGAPEARLLEPAGRAKPFDMAYERRQPVTAIVRRDRDGELTLERAIWDAIR